MIIPPDRLAETKPCANCGMTLHLMKRDASRWSQRRFCSKACSSASQRGAAKPRRRTAIRNPWTEAEIAILRTGYERRLTDVAISRLLPGRCLDSVQAKAQSLLLVLGEPAVKARRVSAPASRSRVLALHAAGMGETSIAAELRVAYRAVAAVLLERRGHCQ